MQSIITRVMALNVMFLIAGSDQFIACAWAERRSEDNRLRKKLAASERSES